jgi:TPR repeat protein
MAASEVTVPLRFWVTSRNQKRLAMKAIGVIALGFVATLAAGCASPWQPKFSPRAQIWIAAGEAYAEGDFSAALTRIKSLADSGDPYAAAGLGSMYKWGGGVSQDHSQAETWYRKAAERGYATAEYMLELVKTNGWPKSHSEQIQWLKKDAEAGVIAAEEVIGNYYWHGKGIPQNFSESVRWFKSSARGGNARAQLDLAQSYVKGAGVPKDDIRAYAWLNLAAAHLLPSALRDVAVAYRNRWRIYLTPDQLSQAQEFARFLEDTQVPQSNPRMPLSVDYETDPSASALEQSDVTEGAK